MSVSILDHFSSLQEPRQSCKVMYPLKEILLVILCGTLSGTDDFVEIEYWAKIKLDFLRRFMPFSYGIPSHDTLNDVMNALPAKAFSDCFISWADSLRECGPEFAAIDGKTSRRAHNKAKGQNPLHFVSAWASRQRLARGKRLVLKNQMRSQRSRLFWSAWS